MLHEISGRYLDPLAAAEIDAAIGARLQNGVYDNLVAYRGPRRRRADDGVPSSARG